MAPSSLQEVDGNCLNFSTNRESMASQGFSLCVLGWGGLYHALEPTTVLLLPRI